MSFGGHRLRFVGSSLQVVVFVAWSVQDEVEVKPTLESELHGLKPQSRYIQFDNTAVAQTKSLLVQSAWVFGLDGKL